jgi:hypothetical protein
MKFFVLFLSVVGSTLSPLTAYADTVFLTDGTIITGNIKDVGNRFVVINTSIGEVSVEGHKVTKLDWMPKESTQIMDRPDAFPAPHPDKVQDSLSPTRQFYSEQHLLKPNGFGIGLTFGIDNDSSGVSYLYDRLLSTNTQVHVQLEEIFREPVVYSGSIAVGEYIGNRTFINTSIETQKISSTYRFFPFTNHGFYLGLGGGISSSTLTLYSISAYNTTLNEYSTNTYKFKSKLNGVFILGEIGWQHYDGYYFHLGIQPAAYVYFNDNFDVNNIPNAAIYYDEISKIHNKQSKLNQFYIEFGWFF